MIANQFCDQLTAVKTGYPLISITWPYRRLRCRPVEVEYSFEVIRWQITSVQMIAGSSLFFIKSIWNMSCWSHYGPALLRFWFQTYLRHENSASYLKIQAGKTFFGGCRLHLSMYWCVHCLIIKLLLFLIVSSSLYLLKRVITQNLSCPRFHNYLLT